jgi:hypothetical protein
MRKMVLPCLVALAAAATASVAWSDDSVTTDPAKSKIVCKKEAVAGTRIPKRVCKSQAQIDAEREVGRNATDEWQRNANMQKARGS